jgi:hypothetical protein
MIPSEPVGTDIERELSFFSPHLAVEQEHLKNVKNGDLDSNKEKLMKLMEVEACLLSPETASQIAGASIEGSKLSNVLLCTPDGLLSRLLLYCLPIVPAP